jgi:serine/threonine-protein kinase RsbW
VETVGQRLARLYDELDVPEKTASAPKIAFAEAISNAVQHGHNGDRALTVDVECSWDADTVALTITDQGEGFACENVDDPTTCQNILRDSGRGLYILKAISSQVNFNDKGNQIRIIVNRSGHCC